MNFSKILHCQILYEYIQWLQNYYQRQNMDAQTAVNRFADIHKDDSGVCLRHFLDCIFCFDVRSNITYFFVFSRMPLVCNLNLHDLIRITI
jgi:hypothetical protein